jgi:hypothetical protein
MRCSVKPVEIRLTLAEQMDESTNQNCKGRVATLAARLAQRQAARHLEVAFDTGGAPRALAPQDTNR